jgi:uncharacterized protein YbaR (Trm112 family)
MTIDPSLLEILACPRCHAPLREDPTSSELVCTSAECGLAYPIRDGIPVLLIDEARGGPSDGQDGAASPGPPA